MSIDVRIDTEDKGFKYRVCGIVIQDNKILIQKIKNNKFYCLPGGHVEIGENTEEAVIREMQEETGNEYKVELLIAINENFFMHKEKRYHELGFYYILSPKKRIETKDYSIIEIDKGEPKKLEFRWVKLEELKDIDFRPAFLIEKLVNKDFKLKHIITEEI